jgi:hypothetical protein
MSIRPTSIYNCGQVSATPVPTPVYVIIGNTALATIYALKLIAALEVGGNVVKPGEIYILSSGTDQTSNVNAIESLSYVATNTRLILSDLVSERIHNILTSTDYIIGSVDTIYQEYYEYYYGAGPLGDSISAYYQPMIGPWFFSDAHSMIANFVKGWTIEYPFKPLGNSSIVMNRLVAQLGLHITNTVVVTRPSILNRNFIFVEEGTKNFLQRQIFYDSFLESKVPPYVHYVNRVNNIHIEPTVDNCYKNVYYSTSNAPTTVKLENACLLWANNLYSYVRILGASNIQHSKIKAPVFYRYVVAIPKVNPITGVDLSNPSMNDECLSDGVTSRICFCCVDPPQLGASPVSNMINSSTPTWNVSVYSTDDDLGYFLPGGQFANPCFSPTGTTRCPCLPNQTLLIVEATSLNNRRTLSWDELNLSVSASLNSNVIELDAYLKFQLICAQVYLAYTGVPPPIDITGGLTCNTDNICTQTNPINHTFNRESPQTTVLRLLTNLYGGSNYPATNGGSSNTECCIKIN